MPGRWDAVRRPTPKEVKATAILSLPLSEASAKVSRGGPDDGESTTPRCPSGPATSRSGSSPATRSPARTSRPASPCRPTWCARSCGPFFFFFVER